MMFRIIAIMIMASFVSACSSFMSANEEGYKTYLDSYYGKPIGEYINAHGQADSTSETPTGNKLFVFHESHLKTSSISCSKDTSDKQTCSGGETTEYKCTTYIEVNEEKRIIGSYFKGNDCVKCPSNSEKVCFGPK